MCHIVCGIFIQTSFRRGEQLGSRHGSEGSARVGARVRWKGKRGLLRSGSAAGKVHSVIRDRETDWTLLCLFLSDGLQLFISLCLATCLVCSFFYDSRLRTLVCFLARSIGRDRCQDVAAGVQEEQRFCVDITVLDVLEPRCGRRWHCLSSLAGLAAV